MRFRAVVTGIAAALAACGGHSTTAAHPAMPTGPLGASIARGRALMLATRESLPDRVGNRLRCVSCHLDEGRRAEGSWVGVYARYPQYRSRSASIQTLEGRINDCFERSLNGRALSPDSREMADIVSYLWWLSQGAVVGPAVERASGPFAALTADSAGGRALFDRSCARCHGAAGEGSAIAPPLWGDSSYNIGAGMARPTRAAVFIRANMPSDAPGQLTDQQAYDVASYIDAQRRPDFAPKLDDWPGGDAPADLPYRTRAGRHP